ncbi:MAG: hypothetical protein M3220_14965 [Chloroflexota bacterium]|nr:hypothetical protein [Chloroflexota bacterium]
MPLLLSILSVLAGWALQLVLVAGLLRILETLNSIRRSLEQITMGVRAIEQQTHPLGARADALATSLRKAEERVGTAARRLDDVDRGPDGAGPVLH